MGPFYIWDILYVSFLYGAKAEEDIGIGFDDFTVKLPEEPVTNWNNIEIK